MDKKVKVIRSDNGTEFKNGVLDGFCKEKGIKREYSVARTPQQNGVAERRNRTLIEATRTMFVDSKLPTTFWAEAVSTACYVQNRVLIVKPYYKTPYELFRGIKPSLSFMKPFGCHVTILNTLDSLGKFDGKSNNGFFVGYSLSSKAFKVYNTRTRKVEENLHIRFLENKTMIEGSGPEWLFDIDSLTQSMNYVPVPTGTTSYECADTSYFDSSTKNDDKGEPKFVDDDPKNDADDLHDEFDDKEDESSFKEDDTVGPQLNTGGPTINTASPEHMFGDDHSLEVTHVDIEPNRVTKALSDPVWVEAMQEELLQFELQKVWILVDLPKGKRPIGLKSIFKNKTDERGIVVRNKARLVTKGHTQEEGIDYDDVFAPVARIEAIRLFLAYSSFMGFMVYQMYVKSAFLYGKMEEEVYVCQPLGFEDPNFPDKVYKVVKAMYGLHQAPRVCQDKYVAEILRKFNYIDVKSASTTIDSEKPFTKDGDAKDVDISSYTKDIPSHSC
ncbi:retrovirus-related pol polyprotein from transposon TNT 1-94 [Tanacetum coccineum]